MQDVEHSKSRFREDYVPACVENLVQWMFDRQKNLQEAMVRENPRCPQTGQVGGRRRPVGVDRQRSVRRDMTQVFCQEGVHIGFPHGSAQQTTPVQEPEWGSTRFVECVVIG